MDIPKKVLQIPARVASRLCLGDQGLQEELESVAWLALAKALRAFDPAQNLQKADGLPNYAYTGCMMACRNARRRYCRTQTRFRSLSSLEPGDDRSGDLNHRLDVTVDPKSEAAQRHSDNRELVGQILKAARTKDLPLLIGVMEGKSFTQIARQVGLTKGAVSSRFYRLANDLRLSLMRDGIRN